MKMVSETESGKYLFKKWINHEQGDEKRLTLNEYDHNIKENEREVFRMKEVRWAVLGTGVIANEMAVAMSKNGDENDE